MFVPLSSHVYTVGEEKPYPTVTSWTEQWSSVSTAYTTEEHTKTKYTFTDDPEDSPASQDIDSLILEKEGNILHIYLTLSHGKFGIPVSYYTRIALDLDGNVWSDYMIWCDSQTECGLWKYPNMPGRGTLVSILQYELKGDDLLHIIVPIQKIGSTSFYIWAEVGYWGGNDFYYADIIGYSDVEGRYELPNPVDLEATYSLTYTLYRTYTHTSMLSSVYTATSTETHTLTEKVPLSYWYAWLPYPFFAGAVALAISTVIPYIKSRRKKAAPPVITLPEGARLVKLCPSCGTENPLEAEYCLECGTKL
jgi:hypothetical protein